jgi:6-phosphogluconolactonase
MQQDLVVAPPETLARHFAERVATEARRALAARGGFALAVSGGSVGDTFLPLLANADVDWPRVDVFWLDERAVPPDHPDSNYRQAWEPWLSRVPAEPARVHRLRGEAADLDAAALAAERELRQAIGPRGRIDVALAGLGPDGHVASLFPGHPALAESARWAVAVTDSPKPPPRRLTLTLRAFAATDLLVVAAFGEAKAEPVRAAYADATSDLPIALAVRRARRRLWLLDAAAAALLPR